MIQANIAAFVARFGAEPTGIVHAPGRVNLIGEHIDYHGFPVLPMAIDRGVDLFYRARKDSVIRAATRHPGCAETEFTASGAVPRAKDGDWSNYLRGPVQSLALESPEPRGLDVLVDSTLPASVGLSSSSALAVAMGLAFADVNRIRVDRPAFAERMAEAERFAGTRGGGMDQAATLLGREGHALHLRLCPLRGEPIRIPEGATIMVAHSLETAEKSAGSRAAYNDRRSEGEAALAAVCRSLGLPAGTRFPDLLVVDDALPRAERILPSPRREYFRHVVAESGRVASAVDALRSGDLRGLGELMVASHESLRVDYGVSTANLDELVSLAMEAGAMGARLTGAGFGGSAIVLASAEVTPEVERRLAEAFYAPRGIPRPGQDGLLFGVRAADGARVGTLEPGEG